MAGALAPENTLTSLVAWTHLCVCRSRRVNVLCMPPTRKLPEGEKENRLHQLRGSPGRTHDSEMLHGTVWVQSPEQAANSSLSTLSHSVQSPAWPSRGRPRIWPGEGCSHIFTCGSEPLGMTLAKLLEVRSKSHLNH